MIPDDPDDSQAVDIPRRRYLKRAIKILFFPITLLLGLPFVGSLIGPMYRTSKASFSKISGFNGSAIGEPVKLSLSYTKIDEFMREDIVESVWVIKHSETAVTVFSPICPHLGCLYNWNPLRQQFDCPCHGSVFSVAGKVLAGPSPRPLDTLPYKIEDNTLYVKWELFEQGIKEKRRG